MEQHVTIRAQWQAGRGGRDWKRGLDKNIVIEQVIEAEAETISYTAVEEDRKVEAVAVIAGIILAAMEQMSPGAAVG
uniref:RNase_PH domain-containing protein n=1 Tax=Ascaris lumbricoides TaxID=6252 RepID=A0A0M3IIL7_ASCLU